MTIFSPKSVGSVETRKSSPGAVLDAHLDLDAAVLGQPLLGDVELRHDLDARVNGVLQLHRRRHHVVEDAVDAEPDPELLLVGLDVDVGGAPLEGVHEQHVGELDDRSLFRRLAELPEVDLVLFLPDRLDVRLGVALESRSISERPPIPAMSSIVSDGPSIASFRLSRAGRLEARRARGRCRGAARASGSSRSTCRSTPRAPSPRPRPARRCSPVMNLMSSMAKTLVGSTMAIVSVAPERESGRTWYFRAVSAGMILMIAGSISKCSRLIEGTPYWRESRLVISSSWTKPRDDERLAELPPFVF